MKNDKMRIVITKQNPVAVTPGLRRRVFFFYFLPLLFFFVLPACKFGSFEDLGLDSKTERKVLRDCVRYINKERKTVVHNMSNTYIYGYYGTYNNNVVVSIYLSRGTYPTIVDKYCFSGIRINTSLERPTLVWKAGDVYPILRAWEKGIVTQADMQNMGSSCFMGKSCSQSGDCYCKKYQSCNCE